MSSSGRFAQFLINFTAHLQCAVNVDYNKGPVYNVYEEKMSMDRGLPSQARGYRTVEQFSEDEAISVFLSDLSIQFETVLVLLII